MSFFSKLFSSSASLPKDVERNKGGGGGASVSQSPAAASAGEPESHRRRDKAAKKDTRKSFMQRVGARPPSPPPPPTIEELEELKMTLFEGDADPAQFRVHRFQQHGILADCVCMAHDPVQSLLAIANNDGVIKVFGAPTIEVTFFGKPEPISLLEFLPGQSRLLVVYLDSVEVIDLKKQVLVGEREFGQRITTVEVAPSPSKFAYIGTSTGNVFLLNIAEEDSLYTSTYSISFAACGGTPYSGLQRHTDMDMRRMKQQRAPGGRAQRVVSSIAVPILLPDSVVSIHTNPEEEQFVLIGFHSGLIAQWNLPKKSLHRAFGPAVPGLTCARWHIDGQRLVAGYASGRLAVWARRAPEKPERVYFIDGGPESKQRRPVVKIRWTVFDNADLLCVLGGTPLDQPQGLWINRYQNDTHQSHTIMLEPTMFDLAPRQDLPPSRMIDFSLVLPSPWPAASQPTALFCLCDDSRLLVHSFRMPGYPLLQQPHPLVFQHSRDCVAIRYYRGTPADESIDPLIRDIFQMYQLPFDIPDWPLTGGSRPQQRGDSSFDLVITGHLSGTLRFWAVAPTHLSLLAAVAVGGPVADFHLYPPTRTLAVITTDRTLRVFKFTTSEAAKQPLLRPSIQQRSPSISVSSPSSSSSSASSSSSSSGSSLPLPNSTSAQSLPQTEPERAPSPAPPAGDLPSDGSNPFLTEPQPVSAALSASSSSSSSSVPRAPSPAPSPPLPQPVDFDSSNSNSSRGPMSVAGSVEVEFDAGKGFYQILVVSDFAAAPSALTVTSQHVAVGDAVGNVHIFSTDTSDPPQSWKVDGTPAVTIDRIRFALVGSGGVLEPMVYVGTNNGRVYWTGLKTPELMTTTTLFVCPGAKDLNFKIGEQTVHNLLMPIDENGSVCARGQTASFLVQCLEYEMNIIALPMHKRVAHISFPEKRVTFACVLPVASLTSPLPSNVVMTLTANGDLDVYSLVNLTKVFSREQAAKDFGLDSLLCMDSRVCALKLASVGNGVFFTFSSQHELLRTALIERLEELVPPHLHDPLRTLPEKPNQGFIKSLFGGFMATAPDHQTLFGAEQYRMESSSSGAASSSSSAATAKVTSARGQVGSLKADLEDTKRKLNERGEKISQLETQAVELREAAEAFRNNARALRQQQQRSWF